MCKPVGFLSLLLACLLSACATPHWVKPEASKTDLAQDQAACVQAIQQPPPFGTTDQTAYEACMNAHGWKQQKSAKLLSKDGAKDRSEHRQAAGAMRKAVARVDFAALA